MNLKVGVQLRSKNEILQEAILSKTETCVPDFFTADDILTVAGISDEEIEVLRKENQNNIDKFLRGRRENE